MLLFLSQQARAAVQVRITHWFIWDILRRLFSLIFAFPPLNNTTSTVPTNELKLERLLNNKPWLCCPRVQADYNNL